MYLRQIVDFMGYEKDDIVFLDFSESSLADFSVSDFELLPFFFLELYPNGKPVFLFDEIQEVAEFEKGLRYLQNKGFAVYITGSSAHLFSRDIASRLRGKTFDLEILPLSVHEYLRFRQFKVKPAYSLAERAKLSSLIREYLRWGGFPEVVLIESIETKKHLLKGYLDTMLLRDVIEKNNVQNVPLIEQILSRAIRSFSKNFSIHKWYNELKSMGFKASKDTLYLYLGYLIETGFLHVIGEYNRNQGTARKMYLIDNGLYEVRRKQEPDLGKSLENAVYLRLFSKEKEISYYQDGSSELDFIMKSKIIQVCHTLTNENLSSEISGFKRFEKKYLSEWQRVVVVWDKEVSGPEYILKFYDFLEKEP